MKKRIEKGNAFVMPAIFWVFVFTIFPLIYSFRVSLSKVSYGKIVGFAGFNNYLRMFGDYRFWGTLRFTLIFVLISVIGTTFLGLGLALVFRMRFMKRQQSILLLVGRFSAMLPYLLLLLYWER